MATILKKIKHWVLNLPGVQGLYLHHVKRYRTNVVVKALSLAHAQELSHTPIEQWPMVKERHVQQIQAVRDGKLDIVDRRSTQWAFLPASIVRTQQPLIKFTPSNIRRFAKTPVPRRAINLIKGAIISLDWNIVPVEGGDGEEDPDVQARINGAKNAFNHPNNSDSWQTLIEIAIDDYCTLGAMVIEPQLTPDINRPFKLWNVDCSTIRVYPSWKESTPNKPRYAQLISTLGDFGAVHFLDSQLMYIRDNPMVDTPFGLGKMEIAFESVANLVGVQQMAGKAGSDQTSRSWLWWEQGNMQQQVDMLRRHLNNNIEGQSRINLMQGMPKPDVIDVPNAQSADLLIDWQEMLIRMIGNAFDLSAMALSVERDVNRSTGEVLDDKDFTSGVVPVAKRIESAFTTFILHRLLGWKDLKFEFVNLEDPDTTIKLTQVTQLYNVNGETPNGARKAVGLPPLMSPYADLTQFECSLLLAQATAQLQDANAENQMNRQTEAQMQMMDQQQQYGQDGQDNSMGDGLSDAASGGMQSASTGAPATIKLKPLKKLTGLKKTPMVGSKVDARTVAAMSLPYLKAAIKAGVVSSDPQQLTDQMEQQEPGILLQLAPDVIEYLDQLLQEQKLKSKGKTAKPSGKAVSKQQQRFDRGQRQNQIFKRRGGSLKGK